MLDFNNPQGNLALLALSFDKVPDVYNQLYSSIDFSEDVTDSEMIARNQAKEALDVSDIFGFEQIWLPITDAIWPVHYVGSQSNSSNSVTTQQLTTEASDAGEVADYLAQDNTYQETTITPGRNIITLKFELQTNLSVVSTIADIITAINKKQKRTIDNYPRVKFFSATRCIFGARLVGISRATVDGWDKEIITLTLEEGLTDEITTKNFMQRELPNQADKIYNAKGEALVDSDLFPEIDKATGSGGEAMGSLDPDTEPVRGVGTQTTAGVSGNILDFKDGYKWFFIGTEEQLTGALVPDFSPSQNINRVPYRQFIVRSRGEITPRNLLGVEYLDDIVTLEDDIPSKYKGNLALVRYLGDMWVGVKNASIS